MKFTLIVMLLFIGCKNSKTNFSTLTDLKPSEKTTSNLINFIPLSVKDYVKNNLPGWAIPDTCDYSKSWWSFYERNQIPYFVTIDLNDDQIADYALILKSHNTLRLFILMGLDGTFTHWVDDAFKATYKEIKFGLIIEPPARIDCVVDNLESSLVLKSNGITLMELEQKVKIFYWDNESIETFRVK